MNGEAPILASGAIVIAAGYAREGHWPTNGTVSVVATGLLAIGAATADGTKAGRIVHALAWLLLLSVVIRAVPHFGKANKKAGTNNG